MSDSYEPLILGLLCHWCAYSAADASGAARIEYPPNIRIVRLPCSGRFEADLALEALASGFDGVLVCGCHPGDCHYLDGNHKAAGRMALLLKILGDLGFQQERLRLEWVSASEAERFAALVAEMTAKLKELGPRTSRAEAVSAVGTPSPGTKALS
jgi:F420-non-reducing hydrogenase iron-sulfur subunit